MLNIENINFETTVKIDGISDIVNKKITEKVNDLLFDIRMDIKECESPIEQIFLIELLENTRNYSFNKKIKELKYDFLDLRVQEEIGKYRVDFSLYLNELGKTPRKKTVKHFVIELDGHDFHEKTKEQVQRDKEKDRFLISEGYTVIRFTGSEIFNNCEEKVHEFLDIVYKECDR